MAETPQRHAQLDRPAGPGHRRLPRRTTCPGCSSTVPAPSCRSPAAASRSTPSWPAGVGDTPGVAAIEVNISCPNVEDRGLVFACDPVAAAPGRRRRAPGHRPAASRCSPSSRPTSPTSSPSPVACVGRRRRRPVDDQHPARAWPSTPTRMRPVLGGVTGGLSGPAIRPVAVRCVWQVHAAMPDVPIIGMGGIRTGADALEFMPAGASRRPVGHRDLQRPDRAGPDPRRAARRLAARGFARLADAVGSRPPQSDHGHPTRGHRMHPRRLSRDGAVRDPAAGSDGRPRAAVRRDRPAREPAARAGGSPTTPPGWSVFAMTVVEALGDRGGRLQAAVGLLRAARLARDRRAGAGRRRPPARPERWCCSTPSAATSARRCRGTPTPTSTSRRRWRSMR